MHDKLEAVLAAKGSEGLTILSAPHTRHHEMYVYQIPCNEADATCPRSTSNATTTFTCRATEIGQNMNNSLYTYNKIAIPAAVLHPHMFKEP
jgi:hypothetical protein